MFAPSPVGSVWEHMHHVPGKLKWEGGEMLRCCNTTAHSAAAAVRQKAIHHRMGPHMPGVPIPRERGLPRCTAVLEPRTPRVLLSLKVFERCPRDWFKCSGENAERTSAAKPENSGGLNTSGILDSFLCHHVQPYPLKSTRTKPPTHAVSALPPVQPSAPPARCNLVFRII